MTYIWVLVVLVFNDGQWRDWNNYHRLEECIEVAQIISLHRENVLIAKCERRIKIE